MAKTCPVARFCQVWRHRNKFSNFLACIALSAPDSDGTRLERIDGITHSGVFGASPDRTRTKGQWKYLYRAVDKAGNTVDFLLTAKRDRKAALRFLYKATGQHGTPAKITIDNSGANTVAIESYNAEHDTEVEIRQVKYLNNVVEQDHRAIKRQLRPMMGFKSFWAASEVILQSPS